MSRSRPLVASSRRLREDRVAVQEADQQALPEEEDEEEELRTGGRGGGGEEEEEGRKKHFTRRWVSTPLKCWLCLQRVSVCICNKAFQGCGKSDGLFQSAK